MRRRGRRDDGQNGRLQIDRGGAASTTKTRVAPSPKGESWSDFIGYSLLPFIPCVCPDHADLCHGAPFGDVRRLPCLSIVSPASRKL